MKREILFRGKRICENKNWVEGCLLNLDADSGHVFIVPFFHGASTLPICRLVEYTSHYVNPDTVGQFTGLTDKNGKKIFEGDIVRGRHWTSYNNKNPEDFHLWRVDWNEKSGLIIFKDSPTSDATMSIHDFADFGEVEVIGNIHDNPELLEGGAENGV